MGTEFKGYVSYQILNQEVQQHFLVFGVFFKTLERKPARWPFAVSFLLPFAASDSVKRA